MGDSTRIRTCHVICQSHIDMAWLWRWDETVGLIRDTFAGEVGLFERHPDYTFCQSQLAAYSAMQERFPELFEKVRHLVREGRWEVVGGEWVECDHLHPSGESLVRQLLQGQLYAREQFGVQARVGWSPDSFGHNGNLPQIMAKAGIECFVFKRPLVNELDLPATPFWWEGIDGTRVLSYRAPNKGWDFVAAIPPEVAQNHNLRHTWGYSGTGDRGGVRPYKVLGEDEHGKHFYSTPSRYFDAVRAEARDLPVVQDELNYCYEGAYSTHADVKQANRECEGLLFLAESLAAARYLEGFPYPADELREAWRTVLFNQFHDILPGTSIPEVYEDVARDYHRVRETLNAVISECARAFAGKEAPDTISVYNPLPYSRSAVVDVPGGGCDSAVDVETGKSVAVHNGRMFAQALPPQRFRGFRLEKSGQVRPAPDGLVMENGLLRVEIDPATGWISSVRDLTTQREVLISPGGNVLTLWKEDSFKDTSAAEWNAWDIGVSDHSEQAQLAGPPQPTLSDCGIPAVRCVHTWRSSTFTSTISLPPDQGFVDIRLECDWQETLVMLRTEFSLALGPDAEAWHEIAYGAVEREINGAEVPTQRWVDLSDATYGAALVNNSRYSCSVRDNTLRLTILRCATNPDPLSDRGHYVFRYRLYPHEGDWRSARTPRKAAELSVPVAVIPGAPFDRPSLPVIEGDSVELGACKISDDGKSLVLRLYEPHGVPARVTLRTARGWESAHEANLLEDAERELSIVDDLVTLDFAPFEIKTVMLR